MSKIRRILFVFFLLFLVIHARVNSRKMPGVDLRVVGSALAAIDQLLAKFRALKSFDMRQIAVLEILRTELEDVWSGGVSYDVEFLTIFLKELHITRSSCYFPREICVTTQEYVILGSLVQHTKVEPAEECIHMLNHSYETCIRRSGFVDSLNAITIEYLSKVDASVIKETPSEYHAITSINQPAFENELAFLVGSSILLALLIHFLCQWAHFLPGQLAQRTRTPERIEVEETGAEPDIQLP
eukprot:c17473_g1_i1.p1 GENE.c17473_g1_i1~~c17473_g1_i1.p1  ORF type:complete len:242 (+),score=25.61 c17473_g1_i1:58-783(+)